MQKKLNEDFIDSYCEKFASKVIDSFFTEGKISITGKEILKVTPSKQTNLFILKLIFEYWKGESKKFESPFFNYENESVVTALAEFMNVLSQNIEVHKDRFQLILNNAVKDAIYLAASPQAYLEVDLDGVSVEKIDDDFIEDNVKYLTIYKKDIENFLSDMRGLSPDDAIDELTDEFEPFSSEEGLKAEAERLSEILPLDPEKILSEEFPEDFNEFDDEVFDNDDESEVEQTKSESVEEKPEEVTPEPEAEPSNEETSEEVDTPVSENVAGEKPTVEEEPTQSQDTSNELRFQTEEESSDSLIHPGWADKVEAPPESMKWGDESGKVSVEETEKEDPGAEQEMTEPFADEFFESVDESGEEDIKEAEPAAESPEESVEEPVATEEESEKDDNSEEKENESETETTEEPADETPVPEPELAEPEVEEESADPEVETINDQFEGTEKTVAEHHEEEKSSSLMSSISVNHQFMFVKELFKDDQVSFQNALYDLEEYSSFDDAVEFLVQGYAKEFEWDMQSNEVKELLKVLFRKYRD